MQEQALPLGLLPVPGWARLSGLPWGARWSIQPQLQLVLKQALASGRQRGLRRVLRWAGVVQPRTPALGAVPETPGRQGEGCVSTVCHNCRRILR